MTSDREELPRASDVNLSPKTALYRFRTYSPYLVPADLHHFSLLKMQLKGYRFNTAAEIKSKSQKVRDTLKKNNFQAGFQKLQEL